MPRAARCQAFEAPSGTLFILEPGGLRIVTEAGDEALVPVRDVVAFLKHLLDPAEPPDAETVP
ncbi:MAG TPA: hypothetical protein VGG03_19830 [Thermoanaerobaculia bacterium]|jgi:hypothetical protein